MSTEFLLTMSDVAHPQRLRIAIWLLTWLPILAGCGKGAYDRQLDATLQQLRSAPAPEAEQEAEPPTEPARNDPDDSADEEDDYQDEDYDDADTGDEPPEADALDPARVEEEPDPDIDADADADADIDPDSADE